MLATSLFKVAVFFSTWAIVWLPIAAFVSRKIQWQPFQPVTAQQKPILIGSLYVIAPAVLWWQTQSEGISFADLGLNWQLSSAVSCVLGLTIALAELAIVFVWESKFNLVSWNWQHWRLLPSLFVPILGLSLAIGSVEELVFRGYVMQKLSTSSYWFAAAITSVIFALLHLVWERQQTIPQLPGLWLMGMVLTLAKLVDGGSLGLAWGLHAGWICGLTCIDSAGLISYNEREIVWLTGVYRQPLAGVAGILCLVVTAVLLSVLGDVRNLVFW